MKALLGLCLFTATLVAAPKYPVDQDIQKLVDKAAYLTEMRDTLASFDCSITLDKNTVKLVPGALRSEGLVIAVSDGFPGNYLAYHKAPKPEQLEGVVNLIYPKGGKNALILTLRMGNSPKASDERVIQVLTNEPEYAGGTLWIYQRGGVTVTLPKNGEVAVATGKSYQGKTLTLRCQ